ncbi:MULTISPECIES: hypothetical protein [unclassified Shewanella]|jgi:hypothetical protein|uniref:hypothetical protein n=1 Tax=unclassified Shewanella TaxID=196818 RepID=UPI00137BCE1E|nr:hypothetical protein [Shewanella sp. Arc9-LZ]QHS15039.1 hypothetical protein GUY17_19005 [Shewanella sp. Arc9-LZ]
MSKLFKLKEYLTIEEAAKHLSTSIDEPVSLADLYRLVLDQHLTMSVRLNSHAYARGGQYITPQNSDLNSFQVDYNLATNAALENPYFLCLDDELQVGENRWLAFDKKVHVIDGVWDLAMIGIESYEIDKLYQKEVGGPEPTLDAINNLFLKRDDFIFRIQTSLQLEGNQYNLTALEARLDNLLRANGLSILDLKHSNNSLALDPLSPAELDEFMALNGALIPYESGEYVESDNYLDLGDVNYQLVIKTGELARFIQSLEDQPTQSKASETNATNSILCLLAAVLAEHKYDWNQRGISTSFAAMTDKQSTPLSDDTIRKILKQIDPAVESRIK